ncbi:MAG: chlorite dismutase family protein [Polyangiaceae bacterium]
MTEEKAPGLPTIDVNEYGGKKDGVRQSLNRRLFMQLLVFDFPHESARIAADLGAAKIPAVVYADTSSPHSFGVLTWSEDPAHFVTKVRPVLAKLPDAKFRDDFAMLGRTYSTGHEPELEFSLLERAIKNVSNEELPWHVWYPLRRSGEFMNVEPIEQSHMMREHAAIGMAYGAQGLASDVRLACHGLDAKDNEFVIGLVARDLHPISHLVQAMRKTRQTSMYITQMGPFFVGHVIDRVRA